MKTTWNLPYSSRRAPVFAKNVVATSQPLAAQAGLQMLRRGGNAVDAALATAIALTVVEPCSNGIGSDAFAIVWDGQRLHGLNASGRAPRAWAPERFAGRDRMPLQGWDSVTVPGAVSAWVALSERFGALPFEALFEAAIGYARDGFPVSPITARGWSASGHMHRDSADFAAAFLPGGRAPAAGERFRFEAQARTLETIAETRGEAFYTGALAAKLVDHAARNGGALTLDDLALHRADWVAPLGQAYRDVVLHELPPNGQGVAALIALGILRHHDVARYPVDSADSVHLQIEAIKLAFAEASRHVADPAAMRITPDALLDEDLLARRALEIDMGRAGAPVSALPTEHGTVYLTSADASGGMVSFIQSNYLGFGSGVVVPETGISLQNRGAGFSLEPGHPNRVAGGMRPFHTIIPGFAMRAGSPLLSFGLMGGHMQAQGHVQMMVRLVDYGQNPQAASDAPRWHVREDFGVVLEEGSDPALAGELARRGHAIVESSAFWLYGGAQLILRLEEGYCGASDHRKDGQAVGF